MQVLDGVHGSVNAACFSESDMFSLLTNKPISFLLNTWVSLLIEFSWSICLDFFVTEELLASEVAAADVSVKVVIGGGGDDWVCSCVRAGELDLVLLFDEKKMC